MSRPVAFRMVSSLEPPKSSWIFSTMKSPGRGSTPPPAQPPGAAHQRRGIDQALEQRRVQRQARTPGSTMNQTMDHDDAARGAPLPPSLRNMFDDTLRPRIATGATGSAKAPPLHDEGRSQILEESARSAADRDAGPRP